MVDLTLTDTDRTRIAEAVAVAEAKSAGEIVTIIAPRSDAYKDIAQDWAIFIAFLALAVYASFAPCYMHILERVFGAWNGAISPREILFALFVALLLKYLGTLLIMQWKPLRLWLTPRWTKRHRVHARAVDLFRVTTAQRTRAKTGVLIYLSEDERMAEIVADAGIHLAMPQELWADAMAALVADVKAGRIADGMVAAIEIVGDKLATHFPHAADDVNELPDGVIEL
jgi:putative membrane protein